MEIHLSWWSQGQKSKDHVLSKAALLNTKDLQKKQFYFSRLLTVQDARQLYSLNSSWTHISSTFP